jgi:hypothetical protein
VTALRIGTHSARPPTDSARPPDFSRAWKIESPLNFQAVPESLRVRAIQDCQGTRKSRASLNRRFQKAVCEVKHRNAVRKRVGPDISICASEFYSYSTTDILELSIDTLNAILSSDSLRIIDADWLLNISLKLVLVIHFYLIIFDLNIQVQKALLDFVVQLIIYI